MFSSPVVFVDIETTGGSPRGSRVLEVAAIRYEHGQVTHEFSTLIDPESHVPRAITALTGITEADIAGAPKFEDIADELVDICDGALFIAHNVRFDYSFLKMEFDKIGIQFQPKLLCTVRLSRALYAHFRGHSLQKLIERHNIPVSARHRALDDARAMMYFAQLAYDEHGDDAFDEAVAKQLKTQSLPPNLSTKQLDEIPNTPGIYIFRDEAQQPLYVGKSIQLKKRVQSHFQDSSSKELKISQQVHSIEVTETSSELAALLLESKTIKQLQPLYNRRLRRTTSYAMFMKSEVNDYATLDIASGAIDVKTDISRVYGVYQSRTKAKMRLVEITRTFQLCPKLMAIEKGSSACFSYALGKCRGACIGEESAERYNRRFEIALQHSKFDAWPHDGAVAVPVDENRSMVIIDQWMIRGFYDNESMSVEETDPSFDVDEYKILRRFLRENKHLIIPADNQPI